ncbi:hypothetical protein [Algoriphagus terrigena]|uniref:hypothetical protein n=1 Tax=Algoriphagus terrigena TaxID=344884 RepID=UPI0006862384|nr:hypothetical protein [Algoriphagus terrigena]
MKDGKSRSLISRLRDSSWSKAFLFLLLVNFINLSANFYEGNILSSDQVQMADPLDTISELIFEWALDGGEDLIPDNGTEQDDNSLEKLKLALLQIPGFELFAPVFERENLACGENPSAVNGHLSSPTPPPDRC